MSNNFSLPEVTGSYADECAAGRSTGGRLVRAMAEGDNPTLLGHVMAQHLGRELSGVEVGFLSAIAEGAVAGVGNPQ